MNRSVPIALIMLGLLTPSSQGAQQRPVFSAWAGDGYVVELPEVLELEGRVIDHVGPLEEVDVEWTVITGPGDVYFVNRFALDTKATFSADGNYVLRLTATEGQMTSEDDVRVRVKALRGNVIRLNSFEKHQIITGWEATANVGFTTSPAYSLFQEELFDLAVEELGINRLRLEVRSGVENQQDWWTMWQNGVIDYTTWRAHRYSTVNDNDNSAFINFSGFQFSEVDQTMNKLVIPIHRRLADLGERLFVNLCYVAVTDQIGDGLEYHHVDPNEYAEAALATMHHLTNDFEVTPDTWEVILEPDNSPFWTGTAIGEALIKTGIRLNSAGFFPKFVAPSTSNMGLAPVYFDEMIQVSGVLMHLSELSYHRYGGVSPATFQAINDRATMYGLDTAHLEYITAGYQELHEDLKLGKTSAWAQYALVSLNGDNGSAYLVVNDDDLSNPTVELGWRTKFLRQYFKFIRSGSQRIGAQTSNPTFDPVAFVTPQDEHVVVIKAGWGGTFYVTGLPAGTYGVNVTKVNSYDIEWPEIELIPGQVLETFISTPGVMTIYRKD